LTFTDEQSLMPPLEPYLRAKRVFLTDGRAVSYAETVMGIVENYHLAEIVGSTTAGTNGNVNTIWLPGGFSLNFTGMKVLKHDGSQHHGVGIHPTIPASRTRQGVAAGRDEVLERGVQVLKGPRPGPTPLISAVVNAASNVGGAVAPGEIVSISGANLGPGGGALTDYDASGYLGAYAGETRVFFDDIQAPVLFASSTQVNAIVPYQVAASTKVRVEHQLRSSDQAALPVAASAPGIFTYPLSGQAVALNQNGALNLSGQPAARGELITFYATGEGQTSPAGVTGRMPLAGKSPSPAGQIAVTFGGVPGEVTFAGAVQAGLLQVQARIPAAAPPGASVPMVLTIGGTSSPRAAVAIK
jgi:uncharacterized protein (TIGR03437 family)